MLRIEEIVGAMDDEFRYTLAEFDDTQLSVLLDDKTALRRIRPVGVSHREAVAMIQGILAARARRAAAEALRRRKERQAGGVRVRRILHDLIERMREVAAPNPPQPAALPVLVPVPVPSAPASPQIVPPRLLLPAPPTARLCLPAPRQRALALPVVVPPPPAAADRPPRFAAAVPPLPAALPPPPANATGQRRGLGPLLLALAATVVAILLAD